MDHRVHWVREKVYFKKPLVQPGLQSWFKPWLLGSVKKQTTKISALQFSSLTWPSILNQVYIALSLFLSCHIGPSWIFKIPFLRWEGKRLKGLLMRFLYVVLLVTHGFCLCYGSMCRAEQVGILYLHCLELLWGIKPLKWIVLWPFLTLVRAFSVTWFSAALISDSCIVLPCHASQNSQLYHSRF